MFNTTTALIRKLDNGFGIIFHELQKVNHKMTQLSDALAKLTADDALLASEVDAVVSALGNVSATVQAAVAKALADAGVDDTASAAAVAAVDASIKAETDKLTAALAPAPPADEPPATPVA